MLSTDVGAAPAAASARLQGNSAAAGAGARSRRDASGSGGAFGEMFDRIADDRPVAEGPGRQAAGKTLRGGQKPETPTTAVVSADDGDTTAGVRTKRPRTQSGITDAAPPATDRPDDAPDSSIVVDPGLMALIPTNPIVVPSDSDGGERPGVGAGIQGAPGGSVEGKAESLDVPAFLEGVQAGIAANAEAADLVAAPPAPAAAVPEAGPQQNGMTSRQVALSALHAALARESAAADHADDASAVADARPADTMQTASAADASIVAQRTEVPAGVQQALAATPAAAVPGLRQAADRTSRPTGEPDAVMGDAQAASASDASISAAAPGEHAVAEAPTATVSNGSMRSAERPRQTVPSDAAVKGQDNGPTATTIGPPVRKGASHEPAPDAAPRPSARVAHAIAAFQAAATATASGAPATFRAHVTEAASAASGLLDRELPAQFVQAIRVQFDNGGGEARVRLNPGFLGGVTVGVQVDGTSVVASLQAGSADVREWLQRNEQSLRQSLADQGLRLERLVIVEEEARASRDDEHRGGRREEQREQSPRRPRRPDDKSTFELVL